jgi:hypothetical protein
MDMAVLTFYVVQLVALRFSIYRPNTWLYVIDVTVTTSVYFVLRVELNDAQRRAVIMICLTYFGVAINVVNVILFGIFLRQWRSLRISRLIEFRHLIHLVGGTTTREGAALLIALLPPTYYYAFVIKRRRSISRLIAAIPLGLLVSVLALTLARGVYAAALGFVALVWALRVSPRLVLFRMTAKRAIALGSGAALLILAASGFGSASQRRSAIGRMQIWHSLWAIVGEHLSIGIGAYNLPLAYRQALPVDRPVTWNAYNWVVQLLLDSGITGSLCFAAIALMSIVYAVRALRRPELSEECRSSAAILISGIVSVLINDLTFSSATQNLSVMCVLWGMCAMTTAPDMRRS